MEPKKFINFFSKQLLSGSVVILGTLELKRRKEKPMKLFFLLYIASH